MKTIQQIGFCAATLTLVGLMGCSGMTTQERGTAIGAGAGAIGGAVLGGGTLGTIGGAAVGGALVMRSPSLKNKTAWQLKT